MKKNIGIAIFALFIAVVISGCNSSSSDSNGELKVTLLQTTDVHDRAGGTGASASYSPVDGLDGSDSTDLTKGGYARLAAKIAGIRNTKNNKNILLVDSGDFLMGTVYDFTLGAGTEESKVAPLAFAFMESIQYDAITLGNHEFDFGPGALYNFIDQAMGNDGNGFSVPILASNMVTDKAAGTSDDGLESLVAAGIIKGVEIKSLDNGLKVGLIGLLGANAETAAPLASPVTFINDMTNADEISALQDIVTNLKTEVDLVIALSHSGVSNTDPANPEGDDITMARKIKGIDIIASGHDHAMTESVIEVENGDHTTYVFCAGNYGKNLAELEISYLPGTGITGVALTNHSIDDSVEGDSATQFIVNMYEEGINAILSHSGLTVHKIVGTTDSDNLGKPHHGKEAGIGNLVADSLRYLTLPYVRTGAITTPTLGVVANGVVRNGFAQGQNISFADLYSVLPLGMTLDPAQQNVPGYPLVQIYLTGAEIKNMCQLISYVIAADDPGFISSLPALSELDVQQRMGLFKLAVGLNSGSPMDLGAYTTYVLPAAGTFPADQAIAAFEAVGTNDSAACRAASTVYAMAALNGEQGLRMVLPMLGNDYFLHTSGVQYTHAGSAGLYQVDPASVKMYANTDIQCAGEPAPVEDAVLYPVVVDIYVVLMMKDPVFVTMLAGLGIPVVPTNHDASVLVDQTNILEYRIDADPVTEGSQEVKEWQAFLTYLTSAATSLGLEGLIPDSAYGEDAINTSSSSRVNQP
ncbi:MAG: bifunctional metallophosphatase/5'-nucleotidase [Desulfobacteraceae bacterium]|nr:bifunctional metallophosphatase/5'-nucleotidase [Desulfobacteraceae bacterium]